MDSVEWLRENWGNIYALGALISGGLTALVLFVGIWWFAAAKYELGGLVLGWLPGGIAAVVLGTVMGFGWPILTPLVIWLGSIFIPEFLRDLT